MLCPECEAHDMRRDDHVWICECGHETSITLRDVVAVAGYDPDDVARKAQMINELGGVEALPVDDLDRPVRRPVDEPVDDVTLFDDPELGDAIDADRWYVLGKATIDRLRALADELQKLSDVASNTRKWGDDYIFVGLVGEALFEKLTGVPMNADPTRISDGGEDFPGVDVKTTTYHVDPFLKWPYGTPPKAKHYFLVAFDVAGGRVRAVGSATAEQLGVASVRQYGTKGQAHTMQAHELAPRLPPGYRRVA